MLGQFQVVKGPNQGQVFVLAKGQKVIGRGPDAWINLSDQKVSRAHCRLQVETDRVLVIDAGSSGGTFVNGERITQHWLQPGDILTLGDTQLAFRWTTTDEQMTESLDGG